METDHHIDRADRICQLCHLQEIETETHFIFGCPSYYEIRGRFHCLFRSSKTLSSFLRYVDPRCLALYLHEAFRFRARFLQPPTRPDTTHKITDFFRALPSARSTKRNMDHPTDTENRSVRSRRGRPTKLQRRPRISSTPGRRRRTSRRHHRQPSVSTRQQTLTSFPQFSSLDLGC